jgi:hypothetical protein
MAVLFTADFDSQTSGAATTASTGASSISSGADAPQHSTAQKIAGASLLFTGSNVTSAAWAFAAPKRPKVFTRFYVYRQANPTANSMIARLTAVGNSSITQIGFSSAGGLIVRSNTSTLVATYTCTIGQWYRVDWSVEGDLSQQRVRLYTGATIHSPNTADAVQGGATLTAAGVSSWPFDQIQIGMVGNPGTWYIDEVAVDDAALPPPWSAPSGRRVERKVSGVWVPQVVEKKVAGAWVPQIVERKDAGVWS